MKSKKELNVSALKDGTVIDHIPSRNLFKVISILDIEKSDKTISIGYNLSSNRLGSKGILKISDTFFQPEAINMIALVAPDASLNIIRDYQVVEKKTVTVPDFISGFVKCMNPKCITNHESILTKFEVVDKKSVDLKCIYCEKITDQDNIRIIHPH